MVWNFVVKFHEISSQSFMETLEKVSHENSHPYLERQCLFFSPWNFYYPPVINSQKSAREAKSNPWSIATKKPGVKVGVNKNADFNAWKKKPDVNNFKKTPVNTENFRKFSRATFLQNWFQNKSALKQTPPPTHTHTHTHTHVNPSLWLAVCLSLSLSACLSLCLCVWDLVQNRNKQKLKRHRRIVKGSTDPGDKKLS